MFIVEFAYQVNLEMLWSRKHLAQSYLFAKQFSWTILNPIELVIGFVRSTSLLGRAAAANLKVCEEMWMFDVGFGFGSKNRLRGAQCLFIFPYSFYSVFS